MADAVNRLFIDVIYRNAEKGLDNIKNNISKFNNTVKSPISSIATNSLDAARDLESLGKSFNRLSDAGLTNNQVLGDATSRFAQLKSSLGTVFKSSKDVDQQFRQLTKSTKAFSFSFLTLIFSGMALERVFGGALRSIYDSYKKLGGVNSQFNKSVLKLNASWNYVKFSIANALNNPLVIKAVQFLTDSFETLGDLFADNEELALSFIGVLAAGFALGKLTSFLGLLAQLKLLWPELSAIAAGAFKYISAAFSLTGLLIVAGIAAFVLAWINNFGKLRDNTLLIFGDIINLFKNLKDNLLSLLGNFFNLFKAIYEGDYELFKIATAGILDTVISLFVQFGAGILKIVNGVFTLIVDIAFAAMKGFVKAILNGINIAIGLVNDLVGLLGFGDIIPEIPTDKIINGFNAVQGPMDAAMSNVSDMYQGIIDAGEGFSFFSDIVAESTEPLMTMATDAELASQSNTKLATSTDLMTSSLENSYVSLIEEIRLLNEQKEAAESAAEAVERLNAAVNKSTNASGSGATYSSVSRS